MIIASGSDNALLSPVEGMPKLLVALHAHHRLRLYKTQRQEILAALGHSLEIVH